MAKEIVHDSRKAQEKIQQYWLKRWFFFFVSSYTGTYSRAMRKAIQKLERH